MTAVSERIEVDLEILVRQHQANVWRYLRYLGASASDADDLTQETFLALSRSAFEERSEHETSAYLRKVARNQLLMLRRSAGRSIDTVELVAAEQVWVDMVEPHGMDGLLAALTDCLERIEGRTRNVLDLFYREGEGRTEIAKTLQMKPEGVKTLLRRTRETLRNCIQSKKLS